VLGVQHLLVALDEAREDLERRGERAREFLGDRLVEAADLLVLALEVLLRAFEPLAVLGDRQLEVAPLQRTLDGAPQVLGGQVILREEVRRTGLQLVAKEVTPMRLYEMFGSN
jgi:hypothetical protein